MEGKQGEEKPQSMMEKMQAEVENIIIPKEYKLIKPVIFASASKPTKVLKLKEMTLQDEIEAERSLVALTDVPWMFCLQHEKVACQIARMVGIPVEDALLLSAKDANRLSAFL
jgi:hypothetical protein